MNIFKDRFKIRIVYKTGYYHDFWCYDFSVERGNYSWTACKSGNKPLLLNPDNMESIWIISHRKGLFK